MTANPAYDPPAQFYMNGDNIGADLQGTTLRFTFIEDGSVVSQYGEVLSELEQTCAGTVCDDLSSDSRFIALAHLDSATRYQHELGIEFHVGTNVVSKVYVSELGSVDFASHDPVDVNSFFPTMDFLWTYPQVAALMHSFISGDIYYAVDPDDGYTAVAFRNMASFIHPPDVMDFTVLLSQENFMQATYHKVPATLQDTAIVGASLGVQPGSEWMLLGLNWDTAICAACPPGMASTEAGADACVWCPGDGCSGHGECNATTGVCSSCDENFSGSGCEEISCPVATGPGCPPFTTTSNPPAAEYQPHTFDLVGQTLRLTFTSMGVIPSYEEPISALEMSCSVCGTSCCTDLAYDSRFESPAAYFTVSSNGRAVYQVPANFTFLGSRLSSVLVDTFGFVGFSDWSGDASLRTGDVSWADFWKYPQLAALANTFTVGNIYTAQDPLTGDMVIAFRDMSSGSSGNFLSSFTVLLSKEDFMQITYHIVSVEDDDYAADANDLIIVGLSLGTTPASTWQPVTDGWSCNVTCADCPAGTASTTQGPDACEACPGDGCSGHGTCDPATGVCTCTALYTGDGCEERQNVTTSMVFGFVTLVLALAFGIPCVCFGKEQSLAKYISRRKVHPFLWQVIVNMDVARHFKNMVAQKKALALVYEEQTITSSRMAMTACFGLIIKRLIAALRQFIKLATVLGAIFFTTYVVLFLQMIGNVFLLARGLFSNETQALEDRMEHIYATLHHFFAKFEFDWLSDFLVGVLKALGKVDFRIIAIDSMDVTCKGSQAPGLLFLNLLVAMGIILLISLNVFPMLKITMSALIGTISDMLSIRRMMGQRGSRIIVVILSAVLSGFQGLFKYGVQLGASLMEFEAFFPRHSSTSYCDNSTMGMDTLLALLSTAIATIFVLPLLHTLLRTFVPGIPKDAKFPSWDDYKAEANQGREDPALLKNVRDSVSRVFNTARSFLRKPSTETKPALGELTDNPNTKIIEAFKPADPDLDSEWVLTHASFKRSQAARHDMMNFTPTPNVPNSDILVNLICYEMFNQGGNTTTLRLYVYCMVWKLWKLLQISCGYWDDDAIRAFHIKELAEKFDDDINDDTDHHTVMISLVGVTHPLLWQLYSTTVVLSKFAEAVNEKEHPPFVVAKNSGITVQSTWSASEVKLTPKSKDGEEVEELPAGRIAAVVAIRVMVHKNSEKSIVVVIRGYSTNFTEDMAVGGMLLLGAHADDELHDEEQLLKVRVDEIVNSVCLRGTINEVDFKRLPRSIVHLLKDYDVDKPHLEGYIDNEKKKGCCAACASVCCTRCCCCCCRCCCKSKDNGDEREVEMEAQHMSRPQESEHIVSAKVVDQSGENGDEHHRQESESSVQLDAKREELGEIEEEEEEQKAEEVESQHGQQDSDSNSGAKPEESSEIGDDDERKVEELESEHHQQEPESCVGAKPEESGDNDEEEEEEEEQKVEGMERHQESSESNSGAKTEASGESSEEEEEEQKAEEMESRQESSESNIAAKPEESGENGGKVEEVESEHRQQNSSESSTGAKPEESGENDDAEEREEQDQHTRHQQESQGSVVIRMDESNDTGSEREKELEAEHHQQESETSFAAKIEQLGEPKRSLPYKVKNKPRHMIVRTAKSFRSLFAGRLYKCIVRVSRFAAELGFVLTPSVTWLVVIFAVSLPSSIVSSLDTFRSCGVDLTELTELLTNPFEFLFGHFCSANGILGGGSSVGGPDQLQGMMNTMGDTVADTLPGGDVIRDVLHDSGALLEMQGAAQGRAKRELQQDARIDLHALRTQLDLALLSTEGLDDVELPDGASETAED